MNEISINLLRVDEQIRDLHRNRHPALLDGAKHHVLELSAAGLVHRDDGGGVRAARRMAAARRDRADSPAAVQADAARVVVAAAHAWVRCDGFTGGVGGVAGEVLEGGLARFSRDLAVRIELAVR